MLCGYCREFRTKRVKELLAHWKETGCHSGRPVWARVFEAHKRGHSGRRILSEAFPAIYKSEPMDEETKEKLRAMQEDRKASGVKFPPKRRKKREGVS